MHESNFTPSTRRQLECIAYVCPCPRKIVGDLAKLLKEEEAVQCVKNFGAELKKNGSTDPVKFIFNDSRRIYYARTDRSSSRSPGAPRRKKAKTAPAPAPAPAPEDAAKLEGAPRTGRLGAGRQCTLEVTVQCLSVVGVRKHISYRRARCGNERAHGASRPDGSDARGS